MALATRPKPKVQHRKRQAQHHRQNKHYLKTYWPYLPMLAIIGAGAALNSAWYENGYFNTAAASSATTRLDALTGSSQWALLAVCLIAAAAFAAIVFRHGYRLHRALNRGENFIVHHPWLDMSLVFIVTASVILTRSAV
jgi:hypothetical protein